MPRYYRTRNRMATRIQRAFRNRRRSRPRLLTRTNTRRINKIVNSEKTFLDTPINYNISNIGQYHDIGLAQIAQGDAEGNRQGDKIVVKSLTLNMLIINRDDIVQAGDQFNNIRVILVKFKCPPNPLAPPLNTNDILENNTWNSLYRKRPSVHYQILFDKYIYLDNQDGDPGAATDNWIPVAKHQHRFQKTIKFKKGLNVTFNRDSAVITLNDLKLFLISDSALPKHPLTTQSVARLNFLP